MELFVEVRRVLATLSINFQTSNIKKKCHKIGVFFFVAMMPVSTLSHLLFDSSEITDIFECSYVFGSSITVTGCFIVLLWKENEIIDFINDLEAMATKSKKQFRTRKYIKKHYIFFRIQFAIGSINVRAKDVKI